MMHKPSFTSGGSERASPRRLSVECRVSEDCEDDLAESEHTDPGSGAETAFESELESEKDERPSARRSSIVRRTGDYHRSDRKRHHRDQLPEECWWRGYAKHYRSRPVLEKDEADFECQANALRAGACSTQGWRCSMQVWPSFSRVSDNVLRLCLPLGEQQTPAAHYSVQSQHASCDKRMTACSLIEKTKHLSAVLTFLVSP